MNTLPSLNELPAANLFGKGDVFVLFGELFGRGYATGLIQQARKAGMDIVGITVGRREKDNTLRPLTEEELATAEANLGGKIINVPLMAGPAGSDNIRRTPSGMLGMAAALPSAATPSLDSGLPQEVLRE